MSEPKRPPAQEADDAAAEYTGTMRGFVIAHHLHNAPDGLTTGQIAALTGLTWRGAWSAMQRVCAVREAAVSFIRYTGEDAGRWVLVTNRNIESLINGFEGNPPMK